MSTADIDPTVVKQSDLIIGDRRDKGTSGGGDAVVAKIQEAHLNRYTKNVPEKVRRSMLEEMSCPFEQQLDLTAEVALARELIKDLSKRYFVLCELLEKTLNKKPTVMAKVQAYTLLRNDCQKNLIDAQRSLKELLMAANTINISNSAEFSASSYNEALMGIIELLEENIDQAQDPEFLDEFRRTVLEDFSVKAVTSNTTDITTDQVVIAMDGTVPIKHDQNTENINVEGSADEEDGGSNNNGAPNTINFDEKF